MAMLNYQRVNPMKKGSMTIQQHATFDHGTRGTVEDSQKNPGGFNTLKFNQKDDGNTMG